MDSYALTNAAAADLRQIARHTLRQWGADKVRTYVSALHRTFETLAAFPDTGRPVDDLQQGYFRIESGSHAVFYRKATPGVLIVRVLHQRMEPRRHLPSSPG